MGSGYDDVQVGVSKSITAVSSISLQKNGAILIISIIGHHEKIRFNDIMQRLDGISPKTLADVLKDLKKENLIHRESFSEIPRRVEYS